MVGVKPAKVRSPSNKEHPHNRKRQNKVKMVPILKSAEPREAEFLLPKEDQLGRRKRRILTPGSSHFHQILHK